MKIKDLLEKKTDNAREGRTLAKALVALEDSFIKESEIMSSVEQEIVSLKDKRSRIMSFINVCISNEEKVDLSTFGDNIKNKEPFLVYQLTDNTPSAIIATHMKIDDVLIPSLKSESKEKIDKLEMDLRKLEGYMSQYLEENKINHVSVTGVGGAETRLQAKYSISDKTQFINWAIDNEAQSELTLTVPVNSTLMSKVIKESGELPPGVSCNRIKKVVFKRS